MKNLLLLATLLCTAAAVQAQLYVQPNGGTDSYVYVNDEILFVEQDVNLVANTNDPNTEASIYLRNLAQLIQGSAGTNNNGTGSLSVYQTVDETSNYHYTFWNPPVGLPSGGAGNTNAGISRYFDCDTCGDQTTAATQVQTTTSPNGSSTTNPITVSTRWIYKKEDSPNNDQEANWVRVNANNNVQAGYGLIMKGVSAGQNTESVTFDMRGRPNNGNISVPVSTGSIRRVLVGNPYPSAIDLKTFWTDNPGITEIRFWDEPKNSEYSHFYTDKSGGWGTWTPGSSGDVQGIYSAPTFSNYNAGGVGGTAGTGTGADYPRRYSPIGQGFEVVTDGSINPIQFNNDQRVYIPEDGTTSNFRGLEGIQNNNENGPGISSEEEEDNSSPFIRMNFVMNETYARQLVLGFSEESTDFFDRGFDGKSPMDAKNGEAYFPVRTLPAGMNPCVIQFVPFQLGKKVPVTLNLTEQTPIVVKTVELNNINFEAFLWDTEEHDFHQITNGEEASLTLDAGLHEDRFFIVFRNPRPNNPNNPGFEPITADISLDFFQNNPSKQLEVSNPEGYDVKEAQIYDMSGKLVYHGSNLGNSTKLSFPTSQFSDGVYLVKLNTAEHGSIDYKITVFNK